MFHCLSQGLFFNTDTTNQFSVFVIANKCILSLVMFTAVFGLPLYCLLVVSGVHYDKTISLIIYKSGKGNPNMIALLFFLNMARKMIFSMMFLPALEGSNSPWFAFFILLIQFTTLTLIVNTAPYVNNIVNWNQFGGNFIQMLAALTILIDKLVDNLKDLALGNSSKKAIAFYTTFREHYLVLTFLGMITVYMVSAIAMIWLGKRKLRDYYLRFFYGMKTDVQDDDEMLDFKGVRMVSIPQA